MAGSFCSASRYLKVKSLKGRTLTLGYWRPLSNNKAVLVPPDGRKMTSGDANGNSYHLLKTNKTIKLEAMFK